MPSRGSGGEQGILLHPSQNLSVLNRNLQGASSIVSLDWAAILTVHTQAAWVRLCRGLHRQAVGVKSGRE